MDVGVVAGSADHSGSRSRILAIESETVSPANVTRPVNIRTERIRRPRCLCACRPEVLAPVQGSCTLRCR